jgi:hypothetical protein
VLAGVALLPHTMANLSCGIQRRIPASISSQLWAASATETIARDASYVAVVRPFSIEIAVRRNLKAAKALGLTIPQSVLLRADEVIQ